MKSLASAIVVLAGIYGMTAALPMMVAAHTIFPYLSFIASGVTLALGVVAWWTSLRYER